MAYSDGFGIMTPLQLVQGALGADKCRSKNSEIRGLGEIEFLAAPFRFFVMRSGETAQLSLPIGRTHELVGDVRVLSLGRDSPVTGTQKLTGRLAIAQSAALVGFVAAQGGDLLPRVKLSST